MGWCNNEKRREHVRQQLQNGVCPTCCRNKTEGFSRCAACRQKHNEVSKQTHWKLKQKVFGH
jgi:hypothetical protein